MAHLDLNLWHQALAHIQSELPSQAYETWFQPTRAVASTLDSLVVEVPNPFFRDWLLGHYTELIERVLGKLSLSKVQVEYTVASQPREPAAPQTQAPPAPRTERAAAPDIVLNPRYTFEQFVIGPSNRFAHAATLAVTDSPAKAYNPLFIYGGVGLGKTHLMQAIGHRLWERFPQSRCIYISSERFTNQLISAIQNRSMASFRERFRSADVLLVDDIHFIGGKESTQEVFFHTFNALYDAHRQIVVSSDRPPKELRGVEERLVSRFEWGLVTDIQPPDLETRVAILRKKAQTQGQGVPDEVTLFIAERISSNIRELEGALNRVIAYSVLTNREVTLSMAQEVLRGMVAETARRVTLERIQRVVAGHFNLSVSELRGKRRTKEVSFARQVAMALARELTESSLPGIGEAFGGRDHATVIYACQKINQARKGDLMMRELINTLTAELRKEL
ncbi:MAG: chromosomal replication initiator protein DnaA [Candidatus Omnitrophica bacterium]|nr:chromosomal replication initiator protein DnaA [Candidatus Omnitrophota bacterium]